MRSTRRAARARRRARRGLLLNSLELASVAYLAALGGLLWWSNAPVLVGWQPRVVLTGSMLPTIRPGDVALIGPGDARGGGLPPGRIVLVDDPSRESGSYLHRVVRVEDDGDLVTKGDANSTEDHPAVTPDRVKGQLRLLVPAVGRPVVWLHDGRYDLLGAALVVTWGAMALTLSLRGRTEPDDAEPDDEVRDAAVPDAAVPDAAVPDDAPRQVALPESPVLLALPEVPDVPDVPEVPEVPEPADAPEPVRPAPPGPVVLSPSAQRLADDLAAFEAAFGASFGAGEDEDVRDFDGSGFDR